jgi:hypothetical protein
MASNIIKELQSLSTQELQKIKNRSKSKERNPLFPQSRQGELPAQSNRNTIIINSGSRLETGISPYDNPQFTIFI